MDKNDIRRKRKARRLALQAMYQWHMTKLDSHEIELQFRISNDFEKIDVDYFSRLLHGISQSISQIDNLYEPYLDRSIDSLNPVERCLLRIGSYELANMLEIPYKVILDESVNMSREFGATDAHKYVNGVLNQVAKTLRATEISEEL
ncbi:transcription antitermination factor NusB [Legionella sp. W05-934-2]|uniref:transcription antitermination factor NusB n=1 Tax=Legionella sp. W05-934-2 TaxID=1198649 RepID=UPI003461C519